MLIQFLQNKNKYAVFTFVFLFLSLVGAIALVKTSQNIQNKAADWPAGCCSNSSGWSRGCPSGEVCDIPNGSCGPGGKSCGPGGFHKDCVGNKCVNVSGAGSNKCSSDSQCSSNPQPTQPPSSNCSESFCNGVTSESTCWTHAVGSGCAWINNKCTCNSSQPGITITGNCDSFTVSGGSVTLSVARCKDEYFPDKTKAQCESDRDKGVGCASTTETFAPGTHSISSNVKCGIFQVDASGAGWSCAKTGCRWKDSDCQTVIPTNTLTPTNTPTLTLTPTPTLPSISCNSFKLNGQSSNLTVTLGTPVNLEATISNFGIISGAKVEAIGKRVVEGTQIQRLAQGDHPSAAFNPTEPGIYVIEVNAYDSSSCNYLCSVGSMLYQNTVGPNRCVTNSADWVDTKTKCTSTGCTHWLTIVPAPTSTPTATRTPTPTNTPVPGQPTSTPTPSPPPANISCLSCLTYNQSWQQITNLNNLKIGESVYFAVTGSGELAKGRFKVTIGGNAGNWQESNQKNTNNEFYLPYLVQQAGAHQVNCEVYSPSSGWR